MHDEPISADFLRNVVEFFQHFRPKFLVEQMTYIRINNRLFGRFYAIFERSELLEIQWTIVENHAEWRRHTRTSRSGAYTGRVLALDRQLTKSRRWRLRGTLFSQLTGNRQKLDNPHLSDGRCFVNHDLPVRNVQPTEFERIILRHSVYNII